MISSVIARLSAEPCSHAATIDQIAAHPNMETGELIDNRLLPITIDSPNKHEMENMTRWLQARDAVEFVDVVFVHFEDDEELETGRIDSN